LKFYCVGDIGRSGSSEVYLFNWNEVPGKDTDRFVEWLEEEGHVQPGEKLDISKTDDGRVITVSGRSTGLIGMEIWNFRVSKKMLYLRCLDKVCFLQKKRMAS
jgi:hypothetical protein